MAFTDSDLEAIQTAIKSGTLRVRYQDRDVTYRSLAELQAIEQKIKSELENRSDQDEGLQKSLGTRRILAYYDKGND